MECAGRVRVSYPSRTSVITLWALGDLHIGNAATEYERLRADIERIKRDPLAIWIGMGDYAEYISPCDPRFDASVLDRTTRAVDLADLGEYLTSRVAQMLAPIRDKCIGLLFGNHEYRYMVERERRMLHAVLCHQLGVPDLGYACFVDLVFHRDGRQRRAVIRRDGCNTREAWTVRVIAMHGSGSARTLGSKIRRLQDAMEYFAANIYLVAHMHSPTAHRRVRIGASHDCRWLEEEQSIGIVTGTYLRSYCQGVTGYTERRMVPPAPLGAVSLRIEPGRKLLAMSI